MVCYFLPLLSGSFKVFSTPENSFWCCVGSGFESHAKYAEAIYYHKDDRLFVNLFIPSRLDWEDLGITLTQHTSFPESDRTVFTIDSATGREATLSFRYPEWSGKPEVTVNGRKVSIGKNASKTRYIDIRRAWQPGDRVEIRYPMSLRVEYTPDTDTRGAVLFGPVVLAGLLGTEGMEAPAPFSDPTVRNDYYTYDYKIPAGLKTRLSADSNNLSRSLKRDGKSLRFTTAGGDTLVPLYEANRQRYVVYWDW